MTQTVSLNKVCKTFSEGESERQVLKDLDLQVARGEAVSIVGASGSGKSTVLNLIGGLSTSDSGKVQVAELVLNDLSIAERTQFRRSKVGFVFQFFHLIPTLTVEENLLLPLQLNGKDDPTEVQTLLEKVGLWDRRDSFPDRLSGGEQQRVAVCRALVHKPVIVLADEPTGNLDQKTASEVLELVISLCKERSTTLLLVTHSETVASACDRSLRLREGQFLGDSPS